MIEVEIVACFVWQHAPITQAGRINVSSAEGEERLCFFLTITCFYYAINCSLFSTSSSTGSRNAYIHQPILRHISPRLDHLQREDRQTNPTSSSQLLLWWRLDCMIEAVCLGVKEQSRTSILCFHGDMLYTLWERFELVSAESVNSCSTAVPNYEWNVFTLKKVKKQGRISFLLYLYFENWWFKDRDLPDEQSLEAD